DECIIVSAGLLITKDVSVGSSAENFTYDNAQYQKIRNVEENNYSHYLYSLNISNVFLGDIWCFRAYATYKDANGNIYEVYGDVVTNESLFS
ncbi:MAG: hypothetical protein SO152_00235, partial [Ruminococcus sp.]|nr:hypothetical protein [Ruminococcus sp.]